jgi:hypothetical protein
MIFPENRGTSRIMCGAGFFQIMRQHKKTPPPEGSGVFFEYMKEEFPCPWQAWQRPTLPGLKP